MYFYIGFTGMFGESHSGSTIHRPADCPKYDMYSGHFNDLSPFLLDERLLYDRCGDFIWSTKFVGNHSPKPYFH